MYVRALQALDRIALRTAARSLERETAVASAGATAGPLEHPDYFESFDDAEIALEFFGRDRFRFRSPVRSGHFRNDVVNGRIFEARRRRFSVEGKPPVVILLHGWNGEKGYEYLFPLLAWRLARLGVTALMLELPYHGARKPPRGEVRNFLSGDLRHMMAATRQAIGDIRTLIHWASRQGYESIGLWGISLGAWLGGLTACAEPGLRALVLMTPVPRIDLAIEQLSFCRHIRASMEGKEISAERLNLISHRPRLPRERILLIESRYDLFAPAETVELLWRQWEEQEIWRVRHGHISVLVSPIVNERAARWVRDKLE